MTTIVDDVWFIKEDNRFSNAWFIKENDRTDNMWFFIPAVSNASINFV